MYKKMYVLLSLLSPSIGMYCVAEQPKTHSPSFTRIGVDAFAGTYFGLKGAQFAVLGGLQGYALWHDYRMPYVKAQQEVKALKLPKVPSGLANGLIQTAKAVRFQGIVLRTVPTFGFAALSFYLASWFGHDAYDEYYGISSSKK